MEGINTTINVGIKSAIKRPSNQSDNNFRGRRRISFCDEKGKQLEQILVRNTLDVTYISEKDVCYLMDRVTQYYTKVETETVRSASCVIA